MSPYISTGCRNIERDVTQRQMVNHLKVLLHAKELCGNLHFDNFFRLEKNLSEGGGPGTALPHWPPVHVSARDSTKPLACTSVLQREQIEPRTPGPAPGGRLRWGTTEFDLFSDKSERWGR